MATTVLSKTFGTATNRKKWTMSVWLKKAFPISEGTIFSSYSTGTTSNYSAFRDNGDTTYEFVENDGSYTINLRPSLKLRDTAAWYHLVLAYDSTQSVAADRVNYYVNGVLQTAWGTETYPTLNQESGINQAALHTIGKNTATDNSYFNGVMAHFHFIDGLQYAASDFGETDSTSGIWVAKSGPSVTYGNNGFFLKFQDTAAFGDDSSGNTNDFALSGTMTQTKDNPDNNFATLNSLDTSIGTAPTISNGNTTTTTADSWVGSTIPIQSGKWYWEVKVPSAGVECVTGVLLANNLNYSGTDWLGVSIAGVYGFAGVSGNKITSGTAASYDSAISQNDIMMFAMDAAAGSLYVGVNGTWLQSSNPATSTSPMISSMGTSETWIPFATISSGGGTCINNFNFGNGYFGTTAISSGNADDAGEGDFEYDVPAGYYAICTNNLGDQS